MTRRSRLAPPRLQSSFVRRVVGTRSPQGTALSAARFPARAGSPPPSTWPRLLLRPRLRSPVGPTVSVESP